MVTFCASKEWHGYVFMFYSLGFQIIQFCDTFGTKTRATTKKNCESQSQVIGNDADAHAQ